MVSSPQTAPNEIVIHEYGGINEIIVREYGETPYNVLGQGVNMS